jgi:hypothetical protein
MPEFVELLVLHYERNKRAGLVPCATSYKIGKGEAWGVAHMLTLFGFPNTANADFWDHGGDGDKSINYVVWPADDGPKRVRIRISTLALGDYNGTPFGIERKGYARIGAAP